MELYQITYNDDDNAGAGRTIFMNLYFTTKSAAKTFVESRYYADSYGVQGYKGNDYDIRTVYMEDIEPKIYSSIMDYQEKMGINIDLTARQNDEKQLENLSKEELIELIKKDEEMKEIKIKQLGNGGAFDYLSVNSSFLIESTKESYFLFDCGYSVYAELRRQDSLKEIDLNKLKYIYISHMDDDHIGSLKTLIYYMFFILKKRVHILAYSDVFKELKAYLSDIDGYVENGVKVKDSLFNLIDIPFGDCKVLDSVKIYPTPTNHFKECWGLRFQLDRDNEFLISGDTKAHNGVANCLSYSTVKFAFHDYSNWNQEDSQVHCCESDFERLYVNTKHKIIKYHNNEDFDGMWRSFSEIVKSLPEKIKN